MSVERVPYGVFVFAVYLIWYQAPSGPTHFSAQKQTHSSFTVTHIMPMCSSASPTLGTNAYTCTPAPLLTPSLRHFIFWLLTTQVNVIKPYYSLLKFIPEYHLGPIASSAQTDPPHLWTQETSLKMWREGIRLFTYFS